MAVAEDRITEKALSLPVEDRLKLIGQLLSSLDLLLREDIERAWAEKAERRVSLTARQALGFQAGMVDLVPKVSYPPSTPLLPEPSLHSCEEESHGGDCW